MNNGMMVTLCESRFCQQNIHSSIDEMLEDFEKEFHAQLNDMRMKGLFCDVVINFPDEGKKIYVHRAVMASCSLYFRALFTSEMRESGQTSIEIPGICCSDMDSIVAYAYTRCANIHSENIENILCAADRLHVFGLVKLCCDFLVENMYSDNAVGILKLAQYFNCRYLEKEAWYYIMKNFTTVSCLSEFQTLTAKDLCQILEADELNVPEEDEAVEAVINWILFDEDNRKEHYFKLLSSVRLGLVQKRTYDSYLLCNENILTSPECGNLVRKGYKLCKSNTQRRASFLQYTANPLLRPRIPNDVIFVLGGWCHNGVCGFLETHDVRADRWYENVKLAFDQNIAYHALVALHKALYVVGGYTATKYLNTTRKFDCYEQTWTEVAPMHAKRCYVCAAVMNGYIYACGGFDGYIRHCSAEFYNPDENQWVMIAPMRHVRSDAGVCELGGMLYVGGGFNGHSCLDSAEMYNPEVNQWTEIEPLSCPRSGVAFAKYHKSVYALGGFSGNRRLKTVERYDPRLNQWIAVADMETSRSNFAATTCDGLLFAIGGYDGTSTTDKVEYYDIFEDRWFKAANLLTGRSATSACTVSGLRNMANYTYYGQDPKYIGSNFRKLSDRNVTRS